MAHQNTTHDTSTREGPNKVTCGKGRAETVNDVPVIYPINRNLPTAYSLNENSHIVDNVRKLYDLELKSAEKEARRAEELRSKKVMFGSYRIQRHEVAAAKHKNLAEEYDEFLRTKEAPLYANIPID